MKKFITENWVSYYTTAVSLLKKFVITDEFFNVITKGMFDEIKPAFRNCKLPIFSTLQK